MALKDINNKPKLGLLKYHTLADIASVREFGLKKYENDVDWQRCDPNDYLHAALRHIFKHLDGEALDKESGLSHISHALTSLMLGNELIFHKNQD